MILYQTRIDLQIPVTARITEMPPSMLVCVIGQVISQLTVYGSSNSVHVCLQGWACGSSKNHPALKEFTSQRRDKTHTYNFLLAVGRKGTVCYLDRWKEVERQGLVNEGYLEQDLGTRTHQKGSCGTQRITKVGRLCSEEQWVA